MTSLLLDTHAFVWALASPDRLGPAARSSIEDPSSNLLVSAASAWEIATKVRLGRWPEAERLATQFSKLADDLRCQVLPISAEHALFAGSLRWDHRDPFDRMLAAQALGEHIALVTKDAAFAGLPGLMCVW